MKYVWNPRTNCVQSAKCRLMPWRRAPRAARQCAPAWCRSSRPPDWPGRAACIPLRRRRTSRASRRSRPWRSADPHWDRPPRGIPKQRPAAPMHQHSASYFCECETEVLWPQKYNLLGKLCTAERYFPEMIITPKFTGESRCKPKSTT